MPSTPGAAARQWPRRCWHETPLPAIGGDTRPLRAGFVGMTFRPESSAALLVHGYDTLIDVRSPSEFAEDHIPGAINLPVLSDAERARVGTIYVQDDAFLARKIGAALVARNSAAHIEGPLAGKQGGWRPLAYCWRGGQRSGSFVSILQQIGWRADVLEGGYRTWRRGVSSALYEAPWPGRVIVLDGDTGTAKTALLARLAERGHQVIDLEGLAAHRGSLFGAVDRPQPSQKAFETALFAARAAIDPARPLVVEAESSKIGDLLIPPGLWKAMRAAPRIVVEAPVEARARYLVGAYSDIVADRPAMRTRIASLRRVAGAEAVARWDDLARVGDVVTLAAELMERHYDPRYARSRERREGRPAVTLRAERLDPENLDRLALLIEAELAEPAL